LLPSSGFQLDANALRTTHPHTQTFTHTTRHSYVHHTLTNASYLDSLTAPERSGVKAFQSRDYFA